MLLALAQNRFNRGNVRKSLMHKPDTDFKLAAARWIEISSILVRVAGAGGAAGLVVGLPQLARQTATRGSV